MSVAEAILPTRRQSLLTREYDLGILINRWSDLPRQLILDGKLSRTALRTDNSIVTFNYFAPETQRADPHAHPFDQLVLVIYGTLNLEIEGRVLVLEPGTAVRIPPNLPHTAWPAGDEEVLNIDIFSPIREDYLFLAAHQVDSFDYAPSSAPETTRFYEPPASGG